MLKTYCYRHNLELRLWKNSENVKDKEWLSLARRTELLDSSEREFSFCIFSVIIRLSMNTIVSQVWILKMYYLSMVTAAIKIEN